MRVAVAGSDVYAYTGTRAPDPALPTVVFVHGAGNDHSVWALQSRYLAWHGRNVLAVDLPAHGRSGGEALASVEAIADWIVRLLDAAGVGRAALVGHSMGALAVLDCAARHAGRVGAVALAGPAAPMTVADALLDAARRNDPVAHELITGWSFSSAGLLGGNRMPGLWLAGNALRLLERTRPGVLAVDLAACNAYAAGVAAAGAVRCPALVIVGTRDLMAPPKSAQPLLDALPGVRVVTLPGCGHAMMAEQPDAVLDALRAFLGGA